jgi:hypothetical protein
VEEASIKEILCEDPTRPKQDVDIDLRRGITIEEVKAALSAGGKTDHRDQTEYAGNSIQNIGK